MAHNYLAADPHFWHSGCNTSCNKRDGGNASR